MLGFVFCRDKDWAADNNVVSVCLIVCDIIFIVPGKEILFLYY